MRQAAERLIKRVICWCIGHAEVRPWWSQWCEHPNGYRHRAILMCCKFCMGTLATTVERTDGAAYIGTYHPCGCSPAAVYSKADQELVRNSVGFMLDRGMSVTRVPSKPTISACRHRDFLTGRPL